MSEKNVIICPNCGIVPYYSTFEVQKVYIFFDAEGNATDLAAEPHSIRGPTVKRCLYCQAKVKIAAIEEE